jgi:hypothetical protein
MTHNLFFTVSACLAVACVFVCSLIVFGSKTVDWLKRPTKNSSFEDKMEYVRKMDLVRADYIETLARSYGLECEVHIFDEPHECDYGQISHLVVFPGCALGAGTGISRNRSHDPPSSRYLGFRFGFADYLRFQVLVPWSP